MSKWRWILGHLTGMLWLRAAFFCAIGIFTALFALFFKDSIPEDYARNIGAEAVDSILEILANSMLVVTVFSLSTMVAAYATASASATPRATELLLKDNAAQNALSSFIGAFLYSLVGIIALHMDIYGESGRLILFVVTLCVILVIIAILLQWIDRLTRLGRVRETIQMVEKATKKAIKQRIDEPSLGGMLLKHYTPKPSHHAITHPDIGYTQHIDMEQLSDLFEKRGLNLFIQAPPGHFNDSHAPIAYSSLPLSAEDEHTIQSAFTIRDDRSFDYDPRYGLIVLGEIASRALSPAMNDPGTAIDVISSAVRLLAPWVKPREHTAEILFPRLYVPVVHTEDLFKDIFMPISRDGAHIMEVGIRLQKAYASLASMGDTKCKEIARLHSALILKQTLSALTLQEHKDLMKSYAFN